MHKERLPSTRKGLKNCKKKLASTELAELRREIAKAWFEDPGSRAREREVTLYSYSK